ncbi:hypothetical protein PGT21_036666 [Puccinia graminis f. sp. tritici]|uniref:Uncharacterized protein n=1 Tax=Puccinia graminis f. sp. tritici TaxID=56615 RepID=A0A5B0SLS7_PUCGR|nr:hypothetical protein PGT21_036666 [Puccinia graminis f. sp. tritici]KAA1138838.1 hypothetical protein PGTUg99_019894 [Puccinia graminis f. sp. tritici]
MKEDINKQFKFNQLPTTTNSNNNNNNRHTHPRNNNNLINKTHKLIRQNHKTIPTTTATQTNNTTFKNLEERLPDQVLELILTQLPDRFGFSSLIRSRTTTYGFINNHYNLNHHPVDQQNESEGTHWVTPPTSFRLINKRWARVGAEVFFKHLSIYSINRLEALVKLFNSSNHCLPSLVRTIVISIKKQDNLRSTPITDHHQRIRELLSKLLKPLTGLRSLAIRGCSPGILFPAPLEIKELFLPQSIIRLAIEFRSQEDSALLSSLPTTINRGATQLPSSSPPSSATPINRGTQTSELIELHAAELNLLLVCLPNLRSLHLSNFRSQPQRPLSRYLPGSHHHSHLQNGAPKNPQAWLSIRSLILTDCELSDCDAQFFANRFAGLETLSISNSFIDHHHISAINHLISPSSRKPRDMPLGQEEPLRLADNLDRLNVCWTDFKYDPSLLLFPGNTESKPGLGSSLSTRYAELDLSGLTRLRVLGLKTPTRVILTHDDHSTPEAGPLTSLQSLALNPQLLFFSSPIHLRSCLAKAPILRQVILLDHPLPSTLLHHPKALDHLGSTSSSLKSGHSINHPPDHNLPALPPPSFNPLNFNHLELASPLWYRKLSFQFFAWNCGFDWVDASSSSSSAPSSSSSSSSF